jgi:Tc5 transposase DNA-binding domain/helix-turn-helix, Psq domain
VKQIEMESDDNIVGIEVEQVRYQKYSKETLEVALEEISEGASIRATSVKYDIPRSTLQERLKALHNGNPEKKCQSLLVPQEEATIADWIEDCAEKGDPLTQQDVRALATELLVKRGERAEGQPLTKGWMRNFLIRNSQIGSQLVTKASSGVSKDHIRKSYQKFVNENVQNVGVLSLTRPER